MISFLQYRFDGISSTTERALVAPIDLELEDAYVVITDAIPDGGTNKAVIDIKADDDTAVIFSADSDALSGISADVPAQLTKQNGIYRYEAGQAIKCKVTISGTLSARDYLLVLKVRQARDL